MSSLSDIRLAAGRGGSPTERESEMISKFTKQPDDAMSLPEFLSEQMTCYLFEAVIRPSDSALVIHLKHLAPALRNGKFFDFAAQFIRDRVGKFASMEASFIGVVDAHNRLNSLDLIFTQYYPALRGDMEFIKKHIAKIGADLNELLVKELGELAKQRTPC